MKKLFLFLSFAFSVIFLSAQSNYNEKLAAILEKIYDDDQAGRLRIDSLQKIYGWKSEQ
jgi:hypothetical protein